MTVIVSNKSPVRRLSCPLDTTFVNSIASYMPNDNDQLGIRRRVGAVKTKTTRTFWRYWPGSRLKCETNERCATRRRLNRNATRRRACLLNLITHSTVCDDDLRFSDVAARQICEIGATAVQIENKTSCPIAGRIRSFVYRNSRLQLTMCFTCPVSVINQVSVFSIQSSCLTKMSFPATLDCPRLRPTSSATDQKYYLQSAKRSLWH